jgi:hypothetical protein
MGAKFAALTAITALLILPVELSAKGETVRVTISGADLSAPIVIGDPEAVARFQVWAGPGTSGNEPQALNVDWSRGAVDRPEGLLIYEVSFATTREDRGTYMVRYALDPSTNQGYVYLPGKTDKEYRDNVRLILRRVEGQWFHAWSEWEEVANPLIAKARTTH